MYVFSKLHPNALKANKKYTPQDSDWVCYWHLFSGDELKTQVITIAHKPTDYVYSFLYPEVAEFYKADERGGLEKKMQEVFKVDNVQEAVNACLKFLDDARIEYLGKPFFVKELA
jgi:hypothetical protein